MINDWEVVEQEDDGKGNHGEYELKVHPKDSKSPTILTFKGKTSTFVKAVMKMKEVFRKGATNEINKVKAKVLDVSVKSATEITLEVNDEKGRGNVMVEIFGPNVKNNQVSVVIKKLKSNDERFVSVAAFSIVKPTFETFMDENTNSKEEDKTEDDDKGNGAKNEDKKCVEVRENKRKRKVVNYNESNSSMEIDEIEEVKNKKNDKDIEKMEIDDTDTKLKNSEMSSKKSLTQEKGNSCDGDVEDPEKRKDKKKSIKSSSPKKTYHNSGDKFASNVKNIPEKYSCLFDKDDMIFSVPGDGSCGVSSAAAFLFKDEMYGVSLRKCINKFLIKHFERKYKDLLPCEEQNPFVRRVGLGEEVSFTDQEQLCKFLDSEQSSFMWADSQDFIALADMFGVRIKIVTIGRPDEKPTVNWIFPDESMKAEREFEGNIKDMVLIHNHDNHFNLIVDKHSDLAKNGSLSQRIIHGIPLSKDFQCFEKDDIDDDSFLMKEESDQVEEMKKEYFKSINEVRHKTAENEKMKMEIKDLKALIDATKESSETNSPKEQTEIITLAETVSEKEDDEKSSQSRNKEPQYNCHQCDFQATEESHLNKHNLIKHTRLEKQVDKQFNCSECDYQTHENINLKKHEEYVHVNKGIQIEIRCKDCGDGFSDKRIFMQHRRTKHEEKVGICRNFLKGQCRFSDNFCWWRHTFEQQHSESSGKNSCYKCNETFDSLAAIMMHRKAVHKEEVKVCEKNRNNECKFSSTYCWFMHDNESVFQSRPENPAPPFTFQ